MILINEQEKKPIAYIIKQAQEKDKKEALTGSEASARKTGQL